MRLLIKLLAPLVATLAGAGAVPAVAQTGGATLRIAIGSFTSEKQCTLYAVTSGTEQASGRSQSAGYIGAYGAAGASSTQLSYKRSWRTELVRDCVTHFVALRQSIEAAVAASGHMVVVPSGTRGAYTLSGRVSEPGIISSSLQTSDASNDSTDAALDVQFSLRDPRGQVVHGNLITKRLNIADRSDTGLVDYQSSVEGRSIYTQLQRETALAVARSVAFKLDPLRVVEVTGQRAKLNYGTPFLSLGATVFLEGPGGEQIKGNIISAFSGSAWAETRGSGDIGAVRPGSLAAFAEADDPAANARVYERVDLP